MEKVSNQGMTMKPLFSTAPLVAVNEPINLTLIPLFFSTETQGTQSYTERHCERSEAIQKIRSDFFTTKVHKGFSQSSYGLTILRSYGLLCAYFVLFVVKKTQLIN